MRMTAIIERKGSSMKPVIVLPLLLALALPVLAGEHENPQASAKERGVGDDYVSAEVKKIDADNGKLTLKHEALKQFDMPPMTMNFRVTDLAILSALVVGDKVRFIPDKVNGQFVAKKIEKIQ
jgi:Cu/Ag efflux protein CusF